MNDIIIDVIGATSGKPRAGRMKSLAAGATSDGPEEAEPPAERKTMLGPCVVVAVSGGNPGRPGNGQVVASGDSRLGSPPTHPAIRGNGQFGGRKRPPGRQRCSNRWPIQWAALVVPAGPDL